MYLFIETRKNNDLRHLVIGKPTKPFTVTDVIKKQIKIMKALFITWLVLAVFYMIGLSALITDLLIQFVKGIQNKIHNWANQ